MMLADEARAVLATLPQPQHEPEPADSADVFGEDSGAFVPDEPASVPPGAERSSERSRDNGVPLDRDARRREAARLVLESGLTVRQAARETGLSSSAVHRAVDAARRSGTAEAAGTAARPEWLPPNFKDGQAFAASYKQAERKIREQGELIAQIRAENDELRAQLEQAVVLLAELKRKGLIA